MIANLGDAFLQMFAKLVGLFFQFVPASAVQGLIGFLVTTWNNAWSDANTIFGPSDWYVPFHEAVYMFVAYLDIELMLVGWYVINLFKRFMRGQ